MRLFVTLLVAGSLNTVAVADDAAVKMTKDELLAFLPGTNVTHVNKGGSTRRWTNDPDGTLAASTDNKKYGSGMGVRIHTSRGTWKVSDDGKYCIDIDWKREAEKWCYSVLKAADGYFLGSVDPGHKIEFAK